MLSALRPCNQSGCVQVAVRGSRWCEKHQQTNEQKERDRIRRDDEINQMYVREPWPSFRRTMIGFNPLCQRLVRGVQCDRAAKIVHHLVSPRQDRSRFVDPTNVVCLCEHCHPNDEGTPWWKPGVDYVATVFRLPSF
jgi:5-methylcytosine-specific restriction enzyme A